MAVKKYKYSILIGILSTGMVPVPQFQVANTVQSKKRVSPPRSPLLQKSTFLAKVAPGYVWVDETSLIFRKSLNPPVFIRQTLSPLGQLTLSALGKATDRETQFLSFYLSPDKQWLLWGGQQADDLIVVASKVDGSKVLSWRRKLKHRLYEGSNLLWMDNHQWVIILLKALSHRATVMEGNLSLPNKLQHVTFEVKTPIFWSLGPFLTLMGTSGKNQIVAFGNGGKFPTAGRNANIVPGLKFTMSKKKVDVHLFDIARPNFQYIKDIQYAPGSHRLAWVCQINTDTWEIRTSQLDGTNVRILGQIATSLAGQQFIPESVRWLPNGRQLSFVCFDKGETGPLANLWKVDDKDN